MTTSRNCATRRTLHGGPVHLANVCINQTHDTKQRLFNRDRQAACR